MKIRRFLSVFLLAVLTVALWASPRAAALEEPDIQCKAALLVDAHTGAVVYAKNEHQELYPASLTKIMTCLLVLEAIDDGTLSKEDVLTASELAVTSIPPDGSNAGIKVGEELTVESLLYCIMLSSANEGCNILAEAVAGSIDAFVEKMNSKAKSLGCEDTHFANTNGLPDTDHYTTAWDLYLITKEARTHQDFMPLVGTVYYEVPATNLSNVRKLRTTNNLITNWYTTGYLYKGAEGIKTGSTSAAGYCLVASASRSGRSLLSVVLGAERIKLEDGTVLTQSFSETIKLYDWGFDSFSRQIILEADELVGEVPVELSQEQNSVKIHPSQEIERLLPNDINPAVDITRTITLDQESVEAPVTKGQVLGKITLSNGDTEYATVDLLADEDVSASRLLVFRRDLLEFLHRPVVWLAAGGTVAAIVLICVLRAVLKSRRRRYSRASSQGRRNSSGYRGRRR